MPWMVAGQDGRVVLHRELLAVLRVGAPAALHPQRLARLRAEQRADDGEEVAAAAAGVDAGDRVAVLLVGVRDPLEDPFEHRQLSPPPRWLPWHESYRSAPTARQACGQPGGGPGPRRGSGLAAGPPHGYPSRVGLPDPPRSPPGSPDAPYDPRFPRRVAPGIRSFTFPLPNAYSRCRRISTEVAFPA